MRVRVERVERVDRKGLVAVADVELDEQLTIVGVRVARYRGTLVVEPPGTRAAWLDTGWHVHVGWSNELGEDIRAAVLARLAADEAHAE